MEKLKIVDETFDTFRSESYTLSVQFTENGYRLGVVDSVRNCVIALITAPFDKPVSLNDDWSSVISTTISENDFLSRDFKSIYLSFESPIFTVVPNDFFIPEKAKQLLDFVHVVPDLYEVRFNTIESIGATLIYAIPSSLTSSWLKKHPKTIFVGHAGPSIAQCSLLKMEKDEPVVFTHFSEKFFINTIAKNNQLHHCNSFNYFDTNDSTYHLINTCKLMGFEPHNLEIIMNGAIPNSLEFENVTGKYFKKFSIDSGSDNHSYSYAIAKHKKTFWNLFNLSLCE